MGDAVEERLVHPFRLGKQLGPVGGRAKRRKLASDQRDREVGGQKESIVKVDP